MIKMTVLKTIGQTWARILFSLLLLSGASALLGAFNTTARAGEDVSATGHAVTTTADKLKQGL